MLRRIIERFLVSLGVIFGAVTLIFLVLNWLPGDAATLIAGEDASPETVHHLRVKLGTDRPLSDQYRTYLVGVLHGDLGTSYVTREPVVRRLAAQLPSTLTLTFSACSVAIVLGVLLGVLSVSYRGRWLDHAIQSLSLFVHSMPSFWLGMLMILLFSVKLGWLPVIGNGGLLPLILPVSTLGIWLSVPLQRLVRDGMLEGLHEPYVTTLRAKGLGERRIFYVHVLRNAVTSTITLLGVLVGESLSNAVIIETLFARQGIGRTTVEAIGQKDVPVVQGAILISSVAYVLVNLFVDLSYTLIDPRTRLQSLKGTR
ncbi:MAG TPA: ABC transporter permease [Polyangiaceae bacterium]|nr:ABC transporter permease [Polyangiaceae bacterium]